MKKTRSLVAPGLVHGRSVMSCSGDRFNGNVELDIIDIAVEVEPMVLCYQE